MEDLLTYKKHLEMLHVSEEYPVKSIICNECLLKYSSAITKWPRGFFFGTAKEIITLVDLKEGEPEAILL